MSDSNEEAPRLAALAGISLPANRESGLTAGLETVRAITKALREFDFVQAEPASRFRPPPPGK